MRLATGTVRRGTVELDDKDLPEGTIVTVLAPEGDETFELGPVEEAQLLAAIEEAKRGRFASVAATPRRRRGDR